MYVHEFVHPSASWRLKEGARPLGGGVTVVVCGPVLEPNLGAIQEQSWFLTAELSIPPAFVFLESYTYPQLAEQSGL